MAEGEGFEPPRASRPGGFQVLKTTGTMGHYRAPKETIPALARFGPLALCSLVSDGGR